MLAAEGALETTTVRLNKNPGICIAPLYFADELLRTEGFTDVRYIEIPTVANAEAVAGGRVDFAPEYGPLLIPEAGVPAGVMVGCFELFGNAGIGGIADLEGQPMMAKRSGYLRTAPTPSSFESGSRATGWISVRSKPRHRASGQARRNTYGP